MTTPDPLDVDIDPDALLPGTRLAEFEIERVLGIGGFGIVYLAFDHALERRVAIKEYMPAKLASRRSGLQISIRSPAQRETFDIGLRSFVNEARLLARFDHPSLVKVYRFWEEHGTAYMVMPYYEGQTLGSARAAMGSPPNEAWLRALAQALLGALETLHAEHVYHRDVAPDNILLQSNGVAVLLDFGAARRVISDGTQALTAILKPNFASVEQYADTGTLRQGAWSDIYSLGAVLHFCLIGRAPAPATHRVLRDELPSLRALSPELTAADGSRYSDAFLGAIDAALCVLPEGRPQSAASFRSMLGGDEAAPPSSPLRGSGGRGSVTQAERASFAPTAALARPASASSASTPRAASPAAAEDSRDGAGAVAPLPAAGGRAALATPRRMVVAVALGLCAALAIAVAHRAGGAASAAPAAHAKPAPDRSPASDLPVAKAPPAAASEAIRHPVRRSDRSTTDEPTRLATTEHPTHTARAACGQRNFISMQFCIERQCRKPEFARDPECIERRQRAAPRSPSDGS